MRFFAKCLYLILTVILFSDCKKVSEDYYPDLIGHWYVYWDYSYVSLFIEKDGTGEYCYHPYSGKNCYSGNIRIEDNIIYIKGIERFKIKQLPTIIDTVSERQYIFEYATGKTKLANWKMKLDGLRPAAFHINGIWTYYKADY